LRSLNAAAKAAISALTILAFSAFFRRYPKLQLSMQKSDLAFIYQVYCGDFT